MKPIAKVPSASSTPTAGSLAGKNIFGKDQSGRDPVQKEVIPFDGGAGHARRDHPKNGGPWLNCWLG